MISRLLEYITRSQIRQHIEKCLPYFLWACWEEYSIQYGSMLLIEKIDTKTEYGRYFSRNSGRSL